MTMYGIMYPRSTGGFPGEVGATLREAKTHITKTLESNGWVDLYQRKNTGWSHVHRFTDANEVKSFKRR